MNSQQEKLGRLGVFLAVRSGSFRKDARRGNSKYVVIPRGCIPAAGKTKEHRFSKALKSNFSNLLN